MCHFYANPLSIFLYGSVTQEHISTDVYNAVRNTNSFQRLVDHSLTDSTDSSRITEEYLNWEPHAEGVETIKKLLESDDFLFDVVLDDLARSQKALDSMTSAVQVLEGARNVVPGFPKMSLSTLYLHGLEGSLQGSPILREFLLSVKKSPSDMTQKMISAIEPIFASSSWSEELSAISHRLGDVLRMKESNEPLRSQFDTSNETLRTTVVAQKVSLSRQKASLSEIEVKYSEVLEKFHDCLQGYFDQELKGDKDAFFSEIFIYNIRGPDRSVFTPKPRHSIERALSSPHDYLNCECCRGSKSSSHEEVSVRVRHFGHANLHSECPAWNPTTNRPFISALFRVGVDDKCT
jgi:origin recognition complex subunit 3